MQLLVALPVMMGLVYFNTATVATDAKDVDVDSAAPREGYPLHNARHLNDHEIESRSRRQQLNDHQVELRSRHLYASPRVIGGNYVSSSTDVPWIARILRKGVGEIYMCTGVLIHQYWVLTAAHCVVGFDKPYKPFPREDFEVAIGEVDPTAARFIGVKGAEFHKSHNTEGILPYDYGLLKLKERQSSSRIICLSSGKGSDGRPYGFGRLFGFGYTHQPSSPGSSVLFNHLKYYDVILLSDHDCVRRSKSKQCTYGYTKSRSTICHEGITPGDRSCHGDSGGPLIVRSSNGSSSGRDELVAVESRMEIVDCKDGCPGVAARIEGGRDWIKRVIGTYNEC